MSAKIEYNNESYKEKCDLLNEHDKSSNIY